MQKLRMVEKLRRNVGELRGKVITVLGLAFKAETDDMRESPAIVIIEKLLGEGARVKVHDPKALENAKRIFGDRVEYFEDEYEAAEGTDAVMIVTEWNEYRNLNLEKLKEVMKGKVIIDCRNVLDPRKARRVEFLYEGVGRK